MALWQEQAADIQMNDKLNCEAKFEEVEDGANDYVKDGLY